MTKLTQSEQTSILFYLFLCFGGAILITLGIAGGAVTGAVTGSLVEVLIKIGFIDSEVELIETKIHSMW